MNKIFTSILLVLVFAVQAQKQCDLTLSGKVADEHNNQGLGFATVAILGGEALTTDADGGFSFRQLCPGQLIISISHVGCDPDTIEIELSSDTSLILALEHHLELLSIVKIEAEKPHQDIASSTSVQSNEVKQSGALDLAQALEKVAGVQSLSTGGNISKPVVHGLHSNRLLIVNDFTRLEAQQWGNEHAPEFDPLSAEEVEVLTGASALRFGTEALAGVIHAKPAKLDTLQGRSGWLYSSIQSNGRSGLFGAKIQGRFLDSIPLFFSFQGSLNRGGDLSAPTYKLTNTGRFGSNADVRLVYAAKRYQIETRYSLVNTELGILSYAHIGNLSDFERALESETPVNASDSFSYDINSPRQKVLHETMAAKITFKPSFTSRLSLRFSRQYNLRQEFDRSIFNRSENDADLQYEITTYQSELLLEQRISVRYKFELGLVYSTQANTYTGRFFIPNFRNHQGGGFMINHYEVGDLEFEAGARFDYRFQQAFMFRNDELFQPITRFQGLSFNAGASYTKQKVKALVNVGQSWRPPSINELYSGGLHHGAAAIEFGDENLQEERVVTVTSNVQFRNTRLFGNSIKLGVTGYAYWFSNFIYLTPLNEPILTIRGAFPSFEYQQIDAFFRGIDFNASYEMHGFELTMNYETVWASDLQSGAWLINVPADQLDVQLTRTLGKKVYSPKLGVGALMVNQQGRYEEGSDYINPPSDFMLLNAGCSGIIRLKKNQLMYALRMNNLLNESYRNYLNRLRYYADDPGRNMTLSLNYTF